MKRIIIILCLFILSGCTSSSLSSCDIIGCINEVIVKDSTLYNKNGSGYKYYIPRDFTLYEENDYNHTIINNNNEYYLYIDILSYYNKAEITYTKNTNIYFGEEIKYNNKSGFIEITENNNYFYIKMMYNYGIIETRVKEDEIKDSVVNMAIILSSIRFNDDVIDNMIGENVLEVKERIFELEGPKEKTDNKTYLEYLEEYGDYESKTEITDPDFIN